jgi:predicted nucleotide-binding protein (sugar kinase/HSP70/actin superfamily)
MHKATFPIMGPYTEAFVYLIEHLGFEPVVPPKTTQETIKLGVRHSSDMVCFPFKTTLGNLIQGLEKGADTIIASAVNPSKKIQETCRFGFYYHIQEQILKRMGYQFTMLFFSCSGLELFKNLRKINPRLGLINFVKTLVNTYRKIREIEEREYVFEKKDINIGLVGEAYTLWEPGVNFDIAHKLKKMGVGVDMSINLSWFLRHQAGIAAEKKHLYPEALRYFPKRIGGHGLESIVNTIDYSKRGFDGVIHLMPLSCMPETTVEMVLNMVSEDYHIPLYQFPIDENRFESGFDTRIETFIKLLRRNKK